MAKRKVALPDPDRALINAALAAARDGASVRARMMAATVFLNEQCSEDDAARAFEIAAMGSCMLVHARNLIYNTIDFIDRERKQAEHQRWWDEWQIKRKSHLRVVLGGKEIRTAGGQL